MKIEENDYDQKIIDLCKREGISISEGEYCFYFSSKPFNKTAQIDLSICRDPKELYECLSVWMNCERKQFLHQHYNEAKLEK